MVRNAEKLAMATQFRKRGFSYTEIAKICGVSKSTVSNWLATKKFSKEVKRANTERAARENAKRIGILNKARQAERTARYREAVRSAETEYKHYKADPLFIAGVMLYKSAGDLTDGNRLRVATADSDVHRIFLKFAKAYLGVTPQQIKFWLLLYPDLSEAECRRQWSKALRLKPEQFYKSQVIPGKHQKQTLQFGVGNTIIGSTVLKHKLTRWIELASKEL